METKSARKKTKSETKLLSTRSHRKKDASDTNGFTDLLHESSNDSVDRKKLLQVLTDVKNGNFAVRMPVDSDGLNGRIFDTLNEIISLNEDMMREFTRASVTIGRQGKLNHRIDLPSKKGAWSDGVTSLNSLISDLVHPTIEIANVISSVA